MNICIVSRSYPTELGRGGYFFVEQLVNQFALQGHNCTIIAPLNVMSKFFIKRPYGAYHEIRYLTQECKVEIFRPRYYARNIKFRGISWLAYAPQRVLERTILRHHLKIDVFYCHFFKPAVVSWRYANKFRIPLFVATGESQIPSINRPCKAFSIEKFSNYLSGVICVSTKNKNEAIALNYVRPEKCLVIPNGVDLTLFRRIDQKECRAKLKLAYPEMTLICVGNIVERKGQDRIVAALERLGNKHIKVIFAGIGNLMKKSDYVLYQGFVPHEMLPLYLNAADAYVIPTRWEGCCNSIIEAMACGLPIISSNREFNLDILNQKNSILINPDSISELSDAINSLYQNQTMRNNLGENAFLTAQNLSIEERAKRILHFMETSI